MQMINSLLQQIIYLAVELPACLITQAMKSLFASSSRYCADRPLIKWLWHALHSINVRFTHLITILHTASDYLSSAVLAIINSTRLLTISILATCIHAGKRLKLLCSQATLSKRIFLITTLPWQFSQLACRHYNQGRDEKPILTRAVYTQTKNQITAFFAFIIRLIVSLSLLIVPLPYKKEKSDTYSLSIRGIAFLANAIFVFILLDYQHAIIDIYMPAFIHFFTVTFFSALATGILIAPQKNLLRSILIAMFAGLLLCWATSPIVLALS